MAAAIADAGWRRLRCGAGAHGERIYAWAFVPPRPARWAGWVLALLGRRQPTRPQELAYDYDLVQPAPATPLTEVVRAAAPRWIIEDTFTRAKGQGGLDHYAVRSWQGWQRHITLARWALAIVAAAAARANGGPPPPPAASSPVASPNCAA
ncbi:MAG TPA: hypothetical protein VFO85_08155 [Vicinamibacteria bacterium]|nr:hypothetical protein [Vicinamibacteria bacterium]